MYLHSSIQFKISYMKIRISVRSLKHWTYRIILILRCNRKVERKEITSTKQKPNFVSLITSGTYCIFS